MLDGLVGLYFHHLRGMRAQIGGFSTRNLLSGPPPMLPLAVRRNGSNFDFGENERAMRQETASAARS